MDFPELSLSQLLLLWGVLSAAYVVFGMTGFGSALLAGPVMTAFMPLSRVVPLLALLDFAAALSNLWREGARADRAEIKRLAPLMLLGSGMGAVILFKTRPDVLLLMLGLFVVAYSLYALSGLKPQRQWSPWLCLPFGLVGGIFSALFGSGGFVYAIYLSGRIADKDRLRVTQSALIGLATLTRLLLFAAAGVYANAAFLQTALLLLPAMLLGTWLGRRITLRLSHQQFMRLLHGVLLASGLSVLARYFW